MTGSELVQSTMTPEVSKTYYAVQRVVHHPPQDPNEFVEEVLQAIWRHPEQFAEIAGRWHRRVVKRKRERNMEFQWRECRDMYEHEAKLKANEGGPRLYYRKSDRSQLTPVPEGWLLETTEPDAVYDMAIAIGGAGDEYDMEKDCYNFLMPPGFDPQALRMFSLIDPVIRKTVSRAIAETVSRVSGIMHEPPEPAKPTASYNGSSTGRT